MPMRHSTARHRRAGDRGFSLVESVVAIGIALVVFMAFAAALISALTSTLAARQNHGATDVMSEQMEAVRAETYTAAALTTTGLVADPEIRLVGGEYRFDPDGAGPTAEERVVTAGTSSARLAPHIREVLRSSTRYTVASYVTQPVDSAGAYKRLTVSVSWRRHEVTLRTTSTTFIANVRRGLPLPKFTLTAAVAVTVEPGGEVHLPLTLTNNGARDTFNLGITAPVGRSWSWTVYRDTNSNGVKESTENVALTDTDANGTRDTGSVEPDLSLTAVAVAVLSPWEALGQVDLTFTAVSAAQPTASSGSVALVDRVLIQSAGCGPTCDSRVWFLRNAASSGNTAQQQNMEMNFGPLAGATLFNYDTDRDSSPGRLILRGGTGSTETVHNRMTTWQRVATEDASFNGEVVIRFYAAIKNFKLNTKGVLTAYVRSQNTSAVWGLRGSASFQINKWGGDFREAVLRVPVNFTVATGRSVEVKIIVPSTAGDDMWAAYDTTSYPAKVTLPAVAP